MNNTTRLILDSIVLHNFKSYKGTHHIKNMDRSFTAIVGPNGSGKSNVIDAILFVLGFRAKKMRHSQVTDLIYNDGKREKECFVELIFNKFRIRREVFINKTTKYYINGEESSSAEVVKVMMEEGVDMEHNRFLILQGEIECIAMMKPKEGLLEFLEDIIGTSSYKKEIEEAQGEIKDLEQARSDSKTSLAFVKKDFDHAEELKVKNEEALKNKLEFLSIKAEVNGMKEELLQRTIQAQEEEKAQLSSKIEELRASNEETRKIFTTYEEKYQKIKKKLNSKEGAFLNAKREFKKAERQEDLQKEAQNKLEKKIKSLKEEIRGISSRNEVKKKEKEIYLKELKENEDELKKLYKEIEKAKASLAKEEKKNCQKPKGDFKLLKENERKLISLLDRKAEISSKSSKMAAEMKMKGSLIEGIEKEVVILKEKISRIKDNKTEVNKSELEKKLADLEKDISLTQKELQKRKSRFAEATQRQETDKKEQEMMKHFLSVKGVLGRLQDVGRISPTYETALRTACTRLNNIIVDTTATADKCMDIIKKKNIPRSTVIVLEKIKEVPPLEKLSSPYLFDLVDCEEEFRKVFYFALTDTIVCEDLGEAEKLAFGKTRRRVVTLDGKLIEKSGVMTGGKGGERVKSYDEIEKALKRMEGIREGLLEKLAFCEEALKLKTYLGEIKNKELVLKKAVNDLEDLKGKFKAFELEELEVQISKTKKEIEEVKKRVENDLDGPIRDLQTDLKIASEKIEILENRSQEINIFLAETLTETNSSLKEKEEELERIQKDLKKEPVDFNTNKLRAIYEEHEEEYNKILSAFKEVQEEMNSSKKQMGDNYHNEIDLKNKFEDLEEKIGDLSLQKAKYTQESKKLNLEIKELVSLSKKVSLSKTPTPKEKEKGWEENYSSQDISDFIKKAEKKLSNSKPMEEIHPGVFEEYMSIKRAYDEAQEDLARVSDKYKEKKTLVESLKNKRYDGFMKGFSEVSKFLKEIYKTLTYGGNAELELVDYLDPFSEGVVLAVMPPKKCWKNVSNLSGGEKTLSSLALIFALHKYKPSPFYVMDEIDAALDYRNVSIISSYLKEMTKNSQFIVISLRNDMFEMSNSVLGVYKTNNISKFLMINIQEIKRGM